MWQQWVNFIVGLWVIVSSYLSFSATTMLTNLTISGAVIAILALWGALEYQRSEEYQRIHRHI
jgi:hypothetical protein